MNSIIIENNKTVSRIIQIGLKSYGYSCDIMPKGDYSKMEFMQKIENSVSKNPYTLVIIDTSNPLLQDSVMMRKIVRAIREKSPEINIIGVILLGQWKMKVDFLNAGGDDALSYPFMMQELLARIQALIRRPKQSYGTVLNLYDMQIDTSSKTVYEKKCEVPLKRKEYNIIEYMAINRNRPISRSELMDHVWDYKRIVSSNTVDVHINKLRRKLQNPERLQTIHGFGYMLKDSSPKKDNESINKGL